LLRIRQKLRFLDTFSRLMLDCNGDLGGPIRAWGGFQLYAIVETGGKQYRVTPGSTLKIEKVQGEKGETYVFDKVLAISDEAGVRVGKPYIEGARVSGTIVRQGKARKILVFKYRAKTNYRRRQGHRQPFTEVRIESIQANA